MRRLSLIPRGFYSGLDSFFGETFDEFFENPWNSVKEWYESREQLKETKDNYELEVKMPGIKKDDIKVTLDNNVLSIIAESKLDEKEEKEEEGVTYFSKRFERFSYNRQFQLPIGVKDISSLYEDGLLKVIMKKPEETKPTEIKVKYKKDE